MSFTLTRQTPDGVYGVIVDRVIVGTITRSTLEVERPVKGTVLRYAKGRNVVRYYVRLMPSKFESASRTISDDPIGSETLKGARDEVARRLADLTLLPR